MSTEKDKDIVLDEMMDVWDNLESVQKYYLIHGIDIEDLYYGKTKRFLSYIRFDKECIKIKRQRDQKIQKINNIITDFCRNQ